MKANIKQVPIHQAFISMLSDIEPSMFTMTTSPDLIKVSYANNTQNDDFEVYPLCDLI